MCTIPISIAVRIVGDAAAGQARRLRARLVHNPYRVPASRYAGSEREMRRIEMRRIEDAAHEIYAISGVGEVRTDVVALLAAYVSGYTAALGKLKAINPYWVNLPSDDIVGICQRMLAGEREIQ